MTAPRTAAHTLLVSRGTATVHADRMVVEIVVSADVLAHYYDVAPSATGGIPIAAITSAAERHKDTLARGIALRDTIGRRIACSHADVQTNWSTGRTEVHGDLNGLWATYSLTYPLDGRPQFVMFQLLANELPIALPAQVSLAAGGAGEARRCSLTLTSGGNVEVVRLDWRNGSPAVAPESSDLSETDVCSAGPTDSIGSFKEVLADIEFGDCAVAVEISIPIPLLETWLPLSREQADWLETAEQDKALRRAKPLVAQALSVHIEGRDITAELLRLEILSPGRPQDAPARRRISPYTAILTAQLRYQNDSPYESVILRWDLFNARVLTVRAAIRSGDLCQEHTFSTYTPTLEWDREAGGAARVAR